MLTIGLEPIQASLHLACMHALIAGWLKQWLLDSINSLPAGTPGRVKHMIANGALDTSYIKILVLDEVDTMLSRGFEEQVW